LEKNGGLKERPSRDEAAIGVKQQYLPDCQKKLTSFGNKTVTLKSGRKKRS